MQARPVIPGRTLLVSRRCTQRLFLMRPDPFVVQLYLYCLAEAAQRFGITVHAWVAMSNHHHLLIRDNHGNYPEFLAHLHKMIAKAMNARLGRSENFWSSEQPSVVHVVQSFDRLQKLLYVLANPVTADLVERAADWPGAISLGEVLAGTTRLVKRPKGYFRLEGPMPEEIALRAERPDGYEHLGEDEWRDLVMAGLAAKEDAARRLRHDENRGVLGRKAVLRTDRYERPAKAEAPKDENPEIACRNKERHEEEAGLLKTFRALYRAALALWRDGDSAVSFPVGTFRMRWFGARVASAAT